MVLSTGKLRRHGRVGLMFLFCALLSLPSLVFPDSPTRILVLPFHVAPGDQEQELQAFSEHADKRIRSAIGLLGGDFVVEEEQEVEKLLRQFPSMTGEEQARNAARKAGADVVVYGLLGVRDSQFHLKGVMWDMRADRANVSTDLKVANIHGLPGVLEVFVKSIGRQLHGSPDLRFYQARQDREKGLSPSGRATSAVSLPRQHGPWVSPEIQGAISAVDIGDVDGDGLSESVFIDKNEVSIRRFENGNLRTLTQFSESPGGYLATEVEDLDRDGVAELILTYLTHAGVESSILRYLNRDLRVAARIRNTILRTVPDPANEKKRILVGQRTDVVDMFSGEMVRFELSGNELVATGTMQLPPGTLLLSYASGRLGKDRTAVQVILSQDQRAMVFDAANNLLATAMDRIYGVDRRMALPSAKGQTSVALPGRLLIADTDGDGENEVLLIKQRDQTSVIQGLAWDGTNLVEKWRTVASSGIISDFRIRDFKNEGIASLVLILIKPDPFLVLTGPRSIVYAYDLVP